MTKTDKELCWAYNKDDCKSFDCKGIDCIDQPKEKKK